jgi:hypothetical protein
VPIDDPLRIFREELKRSEFGGSEGDRFTMEAGFHCGEVDTSCTELKVFRICRLLSGAVTNCSSYSGQKLPWAERFCDIVIGAQI